MLIAYVDESNQGDFVSFGALITDGPGVASLGQALDDTVWDAARQFSVDPSAELHGYDLFHEKKDWTGVPPRARIHTYKAALSAVVSHDVSLILRWTSQAALRSRQDAAGYPDRWSADRTVFQFLLQRINDLARSKNEYALVIADIRGDRESQRERFAEYKLLGTPGEYRSTRLERIVDTVHFVPSHHSRMIQAIDLITFINQRSRTSREPNEKAQAATDELRDLVNNSGKLFACGSWP